MVLNSLYTHSSLLQRPLESQHGLLLVGVGAPNASLAANGMSGKQAFHQGADFFC